MKKSILIDGYNLALQKGTGVATYARNLSLEVAALGHEIQVLYGERIGDKSEPLLREIGFFDPKKEPKSTLGRSSESIKLAFSGLSSAKPREVAVSGSVLSRAFDARLPAYNQILNANSLFKKSAISFQLGGRFTKVELPNSADIAHWTYPLPLTAKGAANIYTLHDLVPLRLPYTTLDNKKSYLKLVRKIAAQADHIVTVSENSKRDIVDLLGVDEVRVTNTYQSVSFPAAMTRADETELARQIESGFEVGFKDYFIFWGSIEPKKNIHGMIEAYLASGVQTPLIIVGARAWKSKEELRLLENKGTKFSKRIIQLSYLPQETLVQLIRGAKAALFPSLYEGFGLPALEAMLLGTPVICSDTSSLPEVVGDAALTVDPYSSSSIAEAIRKLDNDADLRSELSSRGTAQAALFSPELYRERLDALYRKLS